MMSRHRLARKGHRTDSRNTYTRTGVGVALWMIAALAFAQDEPSGPEGKVEIGVGWTDNLNRDQDEVESNIGRLGLGFAGRTDRRLLRAALSGDIEYRTYDADELLVDDEVLGSVDALLELHAVKDVALWDFGYSYGQVRIDAFGAVGPLNRQRTTTFSTGPKLELPLGERTSLQLVGTLSDQNFEVTNELDGRSTGVRLGLAREIDPVTEVTLAVDARNIEYDLDSQENDIRTASIEYRRELASGEAFVSIGRGRAEIDDAESDPVTVGRLRWRRAVASRSHVEICAGREITDAGDAFAAAGVAIGCPGDLGSLASVARTSDNRGQGIIATQNPLVRSGGSLSFEVDSEFGDIRATFSLAQDRFEEDTTFDNDSTVIEVSGSRDFARHWRANLTARLWMQDFVESGDENEDQTIRFALSRLFGRNMRLTFSYERTRRADGVRPFDANDYFLSFGRDFGR